MQNASANLFSGGGSAYHDTRFIPAKGEFSLLPFWCLYSASFAAFLFTLSEAGASAESSLYAIETISDRRYSKPDKPAFAQEKTDMKKAILTITMPSVICTAVCFCLYKTSEHKIILAAAITFGTTAYHLFMRLGAGFIFNKVMSNKADYTKRRYQCSA